MSPLRACALLLALATIACSSDDGAGPDIGSSGDAASDAVAADLLTPDTTAPLDTGPAADAALADQATADQAAGCVVKRVSNKNLCGPHCGVRLLLPGGDYYCTQQCAATSTCTPYGANLVCPGFGACVPSCTKDASCVALGFKRCDVTGGNCDTI